MERGANFLPTNLAITEDQDWRPLIEAIRGIFDIGLGEKIVFGLDHGYVSESRPFSVASFMPPPPFIYMFTHVLPAFRKLGLTEEEEETIMLRNPQRILPIR
jgi:predicted metal-dependent phosphotriesterase family hydrolase